jgi:hypothetical protein
MLNLHELRSHATRSLHNLVSTRTKSRLHFLLITTNNAICKSQIFPFYHYKDKLLHDYQITFSEIDINKYLYNGKRHSRKPDVVFFQPWFNRTHADLSSNLQQIKSEYSDARLVFLDSYAPLDLRFAELVNPWIDVYVKKHVLIDKSQYGTPTIGDTNLSNYYGNLYSIDQPPYIHQIPSDFFEKLVIGAGFDISTRILPFISRQSLPPQHNRRIDLHARLGGAGEGWYGKMRAHAESIVSSMSDINSVTGANINYSQYIKEMEQSKLCFSPFGFGEVCWRDYEAIMCGTLLVKPDMSHVETNPNIYRPFETYIPVKWDFSDVPDKIRYYLANKDESAKIVSNAYAVLRNNISGESFLSSIAKILEKCGGFKS